MSNPDPQPVEIRIRAGSEETASAVEALVRELFAAVEETFPGLSWQAEPVARVEAAGPGETWEVLGALRMPADAPPPKRRRRAPPRSA